MAYGAGGANVRSRMLPASGGETSSYARQSGSSLLPFCSTQRRVWAGWREEVEGLVAGGGRPPFAGGDDPKVIRAAVQSGQVDRDLFRGVSGGKHRIWDGSALAVFDCWPVNDVVFGFESVRVDLRQDVRGRFGHRFVFENEVIVGAA